MNKIKKLINNLIENFLEKHYYYKIENLIIGGHCGLCGAWIPDEIFPKFWAIGICKKCIKEYGD